MTICLHPAACDASVCLAIPHPETPERKIALSLDAVLSHGRMLNFVFQIEAVAMSRAWDGTLIEFNVGPGESSARSAQYPRLIAPLHRPVPFVELQPALDLSAPILGTTAISLLQPMQSPNCPTADAAVNPNNC
ncbi:hypothetical protein QAD02_000378 [Eretmocerus hayati]|uniref:Uncharacterized protein n=1 Tax=Eretmocerus hayati TaxID=131215 RepID=A0ACC2NDI5_9HYME|nr:hypothetical protein QAD02_000378 [Eretmocerus hayati]